MKCKNCNERLKGPDQKQFCSKKCASLDYVANRSEVMCPKCHKSLKTRWNHHISKCEGPTSPKVKKPSKLIRDCEECHASYKARETKQRFCSDPCFRSWKKRHPLVLNEKQRLRLSENIKDRYAAGWMPKAGRCKKFEYNSPIAGQVLLDGTWELRVAKWLDCQGLNWRRNTQRFKYFNLKGIESHYTPDFYIEEWKSYLEVKGYETELDRCKWSQFSKPLIVWKAEQINQLRE